MAARYFTFPSLSFLLLAPSFARSLPPPRFIFTFFAIVDRLLFCVHSFLRSVGCGLLNLIRRFFWAYREFRIFFFCATSNLKYWVRGLDICWNRNKKKNYRIYILFLQRLYSTTRKKPTRTIHTVFAIIHPGGGGVST